MTAARIARSEFILGGQKSGKSRRAEALAAAWLARSPDHRAVLIATAEPHDAEMRERIARHQRERAARVPGLTTVEAPRDLAGAIADAGGADTLRIVDCLTLWLTQQLMPHGVDFEQNTRQASANIALSAIFIVVNRRSRSCPCRCRVAPGCALCPGCGWPPR